MKHDTDTPRLIGSIYILEPNLELLLSLINVVDTKLRDGSKLDV